MLVNIVDHRENAYGTTVDAVLEPAWHDNKVAGATCHPKNANDVEQHFQVSIADMVALAQAKAGDYTLFLYTKNATSR
jgi:hypothetical protein